MKRVLCLIDRLGFGGAERQMIGLAVFLKQQSYYVDLVTYDEHNFASEEIEKNKISVVKLYTRNNKLSKLLAVRRQIRKNGYDAVIAYKDGATSIACLIKMLGARFNLIVSERNTTQSKSLYSSVKFFLYRFSNYIVPNARAQEEFIRKNYPHLAYKTITITNFTDTEYFIPIKNNKQNSQLVFLTVARIADQKNILNYLDAVKKVKDQGLDVWFKWFGNIQTGEEEYGNLCMEKVRTLGLSDIISFYPALTSIVKEYQDCDVFCLPSRYEGYPNVICEAMSCGKPIICSRVCDNSFIIDEGLNGMLFNPLDVDDIADTICRMYHLSNEQRIKMGEYSRVIAEGRFSTQSFVRKYIDLIENQL